MNRIAAALLIVATVAALNGGMLREAFARDPSAPVAAPRGNAVELVATRSAKVLSLLLILESLRQSQLSLDGPKV